MDYAALGKRIKSERLKVNLTQAELAEKVDVTTAFIGQIERGERKFSIETLVNIATVLNIPVDYLLRADFSGNINSIISELINLTGNREYHDIVLAVDIIKSVFERIDKQK